MKRLVTLLCCACGAAAPAIAGAGGADAVREVLRVRGALDSRDRDRLVDELAGLEPDAVPVLFGLVTGEGLAEMLRAFEADDAGASGVSLACAPDALSGLALEALGRHSAEDVLRHLEARRAAGLSDAHRSAVPVIGALGSAEGLDLLLGIAADRGDLALEYRSVRRPLVAALSRLLESDRATAGRLSHEVGSLPEPVLDVVVEALGASAARGAPDLLAALLRDGRADAVAVLARLGEALATRPWSAEDDPIREVRRLAHFGTAAERRAACACLARAGDVGSLEILAEALADDDMGVRRAARWALERLTGAAIPRTASEWERWIDERERAWRGERAELARALEAPDRATVMAAIARLACTPVRRAEAAGLLAGILPHAEPEVTRVACDGIARLGAASVVPPLVDALFEASDAHADAIARALEVLTGERLGSDPRVWYAWL